jgi:hypothetical protein
VSERGPAGKIRYHLHAVAVGTGGLWKHDWEDEKVAAIIGNPFREDVGE